MRSVAPASSPLRQAAPASRPGAVRHAALWVAVGIALSPAAKCWREPSGPPSFNPRFDGYSRKAKRPCPRATRLEGEARWQISGLSGRSPEGVTFSIERSGR
ncbi:MAG TPA: hypothetical protein VFG66_07890 [Gemmatimonadales bacterium]|nr:hypothetical protein [Gemmatimonadales bacterium]